MPPDQRTGTHAHSSPSGTVRPVETVEPTPVNAAAPPQPPKPIYRSVSVTGWAFVLFAFVINRKLGVIVLLVMLLFVVFPQLTSSSAARGAGKTWRKLFGRKTR